jgi:hypothetical protein
MHDGHEHPAGDPAPRRGPGPGHNRPEDRQTVQWQTVHGEAAKPALRHHAEPDLDLVETAFGEAFAVAADPTSLLRLAGVPFEARDARNARLVLLRVDVEAITDVGAVMPHLGGESFRYDPLPAKMTSRRRTLRFIYFDGEGLLPLTLAEAKALLQPPQLPQNA